MKWLLELVPAVFRLYTDWRARRSRAVSQLHVLPNGKILAQCRDGSLWQGWLRDEPPTAGSFEAWASRNGGRWSRIPDPPADDDHNNDE